MKKLGTFLTLLLLVPTFSFAQIATTTATSTNPHAALIASLESLLQTLEAEIQQILANQATQTTTLNQLSQQQTFGNTQTSGTVSSMTDEQPQVPTCVPNPVLTFSVITPNGSNILPINLGNPSQFQAIYTTGCPLDLSTPYAFTNDDANGQASEYYGTFGDPWKSWTFSPDGLTATFNGGKAGLSLQYSTSTTITFTATVGTTTATAIVQVQ